MEEKKIIPSEKKAELPDEKLKNVVGGLTIRIGFALSCPKCDQTFPSLEDLRKHDITCKG